MFFSRPSFAPDTDIANLSGQVIIVTGGNSGLGRETIYQLAKHNPARVYMAARSKDKAEVAIRELNDQHSSLSPIKFLPLNLASLTSVKAAAAEFLANESRLDLLINNAGIMMTAADTSADGYEIQFGTNVIGHALLMRLLLPILQNTNRTLNPEARVVTVSSGAEGMGPAALDTLDLTTALRTDMSNWNTTARYSLSKRADLQYSIALSRHVKDCKFIAIHPGMVLTNLGNAVSGLFLRIFLIIAIMGSAIIGLVKSPSEGALTQLWAATSPDTVNGEAYDGPNKVWNSSKESRNHDAQENMYNYIEGELAKYL